MTEKVRICIHHYRGMKCEQPVILRSHGLLCYEHYHAQQRSHPQKPRKPQPLWKGLTPQKDDEIVADIIATDKQAIAEGRIVVVQKGNTDPVFFRTLEPTQVISPLA